MTEKRYIMEYVNCEVSTIIDTVENEELTAEQIVDLLNENEQLKQQINDTEIAVEIETEKCMQRVFNAIDNKIDRLEKKYEFGHTEYQGCPMHNIMHSINTLKQLRKELK